MLVLSNNTFDSCTSQQGGAIYTEQIRNTLVTGDNTFTSNRVIKYAIEFQIPINLDKNKKFQRLTVSSLMGKGPVIFYDCAYNNRCVFQVNEGVSFNDSKVFDVASGKFEIDSGDNFTNIKSLYFTDIMPIVPDSLKPSLEQRFLLFFLGSKAIVMSNLTDEASYLSIAKTQIDSYLPLTFKPTEALDVSNQTQID